MSKPDLADCQHRGREFAAKCFCRHPHHAGTRASRLVIWDTCVDCPLFAPRSDDGSVPYVPPPGGGPGTELVQLLQAAGVPSCQQCKDLARRMDLWGQSLCRQRLDQIINDLYPRARVWVTENKPWAYRLLEVTGKEETAIKAALRPLVLKAIAAAEPSGPQLTETSSQTSR